MTERTVRRDWQKARMLLREALAKQDMSELDPGSEEWAALSGLLDEALELPQHERAA